MPANTPIYGWPYPVGTDRVADGDNAIQDLAEAIEATVDGLPIIDQNFTTSITLGTNVVLNAFLGGVATIGRVGNLAIFRLPFDTTGTLADDATIATLPSGWRPAETWLGTIAKVSSTGGTATACTVNSAGVVAARTALGAADTDYLCSIVYSISGSPP